MKNSVRIVLIILLVLAGQLARSAQAQLVISAVPPADELTVGTKEAVPFAMKDKNGEWQGISIDLWRRMAADMGVRFHFVEAQTVEELIDGVAAGNFDLAVGALTITPARERVIEFSQPFYNTNLGVAVSASGVASWVPVIRSMTSFGFAQAVLALIGLSIFAGLLVWLFEHRHNEQFGGSTVKGLSSSILWSTTAMTQRSVDAFRPTTLPGRIVAIFWMVVSIVAIAVFTAGLTSVLTTKKLQGLVQNVGDLSSARVGTVSATATEAALGRMRVRFRGFPSVQDGLEAVRVGTIDAFVHDKPILGWTIRQSFQSSVVLLDISFEPQTYGFALKPESPLRKQLNLALLSAVQSDWWQGTLFRYFGEN